MKILQLLKIPEILVLTTVKLIMKQIFNLLINKCL